MQLVSSGSQILSDLKGMLPETETRDRAKSSSNSKFLQSIQNLKDSDAEEQKIAD